MIRGSVDASQLIARFSRLPQETLNALVPTMDKVGDNLQNYIRSEKLRGQVLKVRTGKLRNSVTHTPPQVSGNSVSTSVGVFDGLPYARIHEYGGTIDVPAVDNKLMVFSAKDGNTVFTRKHRAFSVNMPERSYLRSSLSDQREAILSQITRAVQRSL